MTMQTWHDAHCAGNETDRHSSWRCFGSVFPTAGQGYYWFDYRNISATRSQFLIALSIREHDVTTGNNLPATNMVHQIDKADGHAQAQTLDMKGWKAIEITDNEKKMILVPAMDAFQGENSDMVCHFVAP